MTFERFIGVDLAWADDRPRRTANESGVAVLGPQGGVLDAGWTTGLDETVLRITEAAGDRSALLFVDAPLVVDNPTGQRLCEKQVGQRYGRWKVSANSTNRSSPRLAGKALRERLERLGAAGWIYDDGHGGPPSHGRVLSECYPYTTLVGAPEFGYEVERPRYKRQPKGWPVAKWRPCRATTCDELIRGLRGLDTADPPLLLNSHRETQRLAEESSPYEDAVYKHREDLIDALLCAWTAALWARHGSSRCQVLGPDSRAGTKPTATIIAPSRPEQRP